MLAALLNDLSRVPQTLPLLDVNCAGKVMTEIVTAILVFFSLTVFLAHTFDAFRAG